MSRKYLHATTIDIHAGGEDLIFPHHENEIAQVECATGQEFAHYWLHNAFLNIDNVKMSNLETSRQCVRSVSIMTFRFSVSSCSRRIIGGF